MAWWSVTKTAIAILALRQVAAGRLALDAALAPALPGDLASGITLRRLLAHEAGLPDYGSLPGWHAAVAAGGDPWPRDRLLAETLAQGRPGPPGQGFHYSNIGYLLAREALERASDRDLATLFAEDLAAPLGLDDSRIATGRADLARVSWLPAGGYHPGWVAHGLAIGPPSAAARLLAALAGGELLPAPLLAEMTRARPLGAAVPGRPWRRHGYGLGLMIGDLGAAGRVIGHSGGGPFSSAAVYHLPDRPGRPTLAAFAPGPGTAAETALAAAAGPA
ncbi:serine hydrolase domain-containing protein [Frigidibacter sp. MR17.24]|uniref:serine hydrolase domain-containing protein n=1 Tax=Frigidibacter sp. MR17.24 TaxID=3127345 RepID=UPI0030131523